MDRTIEITERLDTKGLKCPQPVIRTKIAIKKLPHGAVLEVISDDAGSKADIPSWAQKTGNQLLSMDEKDGVFTYVIRKSAGKESVKKEEGVQSSTKKKMLLICSQGELDKAYPPLILASTAASMDIDVELFFTFYGLNIINRHKFRKLKVSPIGNPAAPITVPNLVAAMPGMTALATMMMRRMMENAKVPDIVELIKTAKELGVKFLACQMTMDVLGIKPEDLIDEVDERVGAATFLARAVDSNINMFV